MIRYLSQFDERKMMFTYLRSNDGTMYRIDKRSRSKFDTNNDYNSFDQMKEICSVTPFKLELIYD